MFILADHNVEGAVQRLLDLWQTPEWATVWTDLGCGVETFKSLAIDIKSSDELIWELCQARSLVLVTANRNAKGEDSLEQVLRRRNQAHHLPAITIANADRVLADRAYADRVAEVLLDRLLMMEHYRGAGRVYVP